MFFICSQGLLTKNMFPSFSRSNRKLGMSHVLAGDDDSIDASQKIIQIIEEGNTFRFRKFTTTGQVVVPHTDQFNFRMVFTSGSVASNM